MSRHRPAKAPPPSPLPPMPPPTPTYLRVAEGVVIDFPAPVLRRDAHCWAATCWPDVSQPGGWARALWWPESWRSGYRPVALEYSDIIEFGADLPLTTGRKPAWHAVRWYGVMLSESRYELIAHGPHRTPDDAQHVAEQLRSSLAYRIIGEIALPAPAPPLRHRGFQIRPELPPGATP